jgi:hypothetical protein
VVTSSEGVTVTGFALQVKTATEASSGSELLSSALMRSEGLCCVNVYCAVTTAEETGQRPGAFTVPGASVTPKTLSAVQ